MINATIFPCFVTWTRRWFSSISRSTFVVSCESSRTPIDSSRSVKEKSLLGEILGGQAQKDRPDDTHKCGYLSRYRAKTTHT